MNVSENNVNPSVISQILNMHRTSVYVPIAFRIKGAPSVELAALLVRKGFHVEGATPAETAFVFIHGPLAHAVSIHLDARVVLAANAFAGVKTMELSHEFLSNVLEGMDDRERDVLPEDAYKMLKMYDNIAALDKLHKSMEELRPKQEAPKADEPDIMGVAHLPNGDEVHIAINRDHAKAFIFGEIEGNEYINKNLVRMLLGFFLSHIGGETEVRRISVAELLAARDDEAAPETETKH